MTGSNTPGRFSYTQRKGPEHVETYNTEHNSYKVLCS